MALEALDINFIHRVTLDCDTNDPKTVFLIRTLTMTQRARVAELAMKISAASGAGSGSESLGLALEAWECLVVGLSMFGGQVDVKPGPFGTCVPSAWFDRNIGRPDVLFELVLKAIQCNMLSQAEKKTSREESGSQTSQVGRVTSADPTGQMMSPDAPATAQSPATPIATDQNCEGAPSRQ